MNPFDSRIDSPIRFLHAYLNLGGESYFKNQFKIANEPDFRFNPKKGVICVQKILPRNDLRGELLNEETNTREYELSFPEYIHEEFQRQFKISKSLIYEQSKKNSDGQDLKLYKRILIDCLDAKKHIDSLGEINFETELDNFIRRILSYAYRKFNRYYPNTTEIKLVKSYYKNRKETNVTGFKLKRQVRNSTMKDFLERIYSFGYVEKNTPKLSIQHFLYGRIPSVPIDWKKDPHELKFLIDCLYDERVLEKKPGQQWKYLQNVFILDGNELELNWHRNHNKLTKDNKRNDIIELVEMLYPKYPR